jgi:hypothetical protein
MPSNRQLVPNLPRERREPLLELGGRNCRRIDA